MKINKIWKHLTIIVLILYTTCTVQKNKTKYKIPEHLNNKINFYLEEFKKFPGKNIFLIKTSSILYDYNYFDDSLYYLVKAEKNNPKKEDLIIIYELEIKIFEKLKEYNNAISYANKLINLQNELKNHLILSHLHFANKNYFTAINNLQKLQNIYPDNFEILKKLSIYLIQVNQFDKAEKNLLKIIHKDFSNIAAHYYLAIIYNKTGETEKFQNELSKVITFGKDTNSKEVAYAYGITAQIFEKKGDLERSIEYFKKSLNIDNSLWEIYYNLSLVYLKNNMSMAAIENLKKAHDLNKSNFHIPVKIGDIYYEKLKLLKLALPYYIEALEFEKDSIKILSRIGTIFYEDNNSEKAIYYFEKITDYNENNNYTLDAYFKIIYMLSSNNNYEIALKRCLEALKRFDDKYQLYFQTAIIYERLNQIEQAQNYYLNSIKYKNDFDSAYINLGKLYYKIGNKKSALEYLSKALELADDIDKQFKIETIINNIKDFKE